MTVRVMIAVVVAGFVIANTFAIVLAQRSRRTALLRLVGATRGQIYRATLSEAAVTGLLASVAGVLAGAGVAGGLGVLLAGSGAPLGSGLTLTPRTLLLSAVDAGDPADLGPGSVLVHRELAAARGWTAGATITLAGRPFRVAAVVADEEPVLAGSPVPAGHLVDVLDADVTAMFPAERGYLAEVDPAAGVSADAARTAVESVLARYPTVNVMDQAAYKKMLTGTVDLVLGFVTALLGLAVVISLVGVANTLSLSVVERTRETAVLRAVGLSRAGMRGVLAVEAVLTALVGTLLGVALGTGVAAGAMAVVARIGGDFTLVLPWARIGLIVAVAVVAALLASVLPARRALSRPVVASLGAD
ncbi:ABC transporter permease [Micromonospora sp. NPDC048887]|uniref:ABC transporter permease n=1 Tax=unclassified Micromonospora TaxID=2617518 RepID=UPI003400580B